MLARQAREVYTDVLRKPLTTALFGSGRLSVLTRQALRDPSRDDVVGYWSVGNAERVRVTEPAFADPLPSELHEKIGTWTFDPPFVAEIADVDLVGRNALPISRRGEYVLENVQGSRIRVTDELVRTISDGVLPRYRNGRADYDRLVSLVGPWSTEFFHWFADQLPRLARLDEYEAATGHAPPVLIPGDAPNWLATSLDLLQIPRERLVEWDGGRKHVERLVVPSLPRQTESTACSDGYIYSPRALRQLATELRGAVSPDVRPTGVGTRLYVSREDQPVRHVRNEDALFSVLADYGFQKVKPERWSLREQIAAFATADAVLGPHGAGLLNVIYADEVTLVELFGRRTNPCFFAISTGMDVEYAAVRGEQVGDHIRVSPDRVAAALDRLLD